MKIYETCINFFIISTIINIWDFLIDIIWQPRDASILYLLIYAWHIVLVQLYYTKQTLNAIKSRTKLKEHYKFTCKLSPLIYIKGDIVFFAIYHICPHGTIVIWQKFQNHQKSSFKFQKVCVLWSWKVIIPRKLFPFFVSKVFQWCVEFFNQNLICTFKLYSN
jgi:hypothetical protein